MPKQALPDSIRTKLGFKDQRKASTRFGDSDQVQVNDAVHYTKGGQEAKAYLKMKSGVPMSTRTSGLVKLQNSSVGYGRPQNQQNQQGQQQQQQSKDMLREKREMYE